MGENIGQLLRQAVIHEPERLALIYRAGEERLTLTRHELEQRALSMLSSLLKKGIRPGDRVALIGENHPDFVAAFFAITYLGASALPIPFRSAEGEIRYRLKDASARLILHDEAREAQVMRALQGEPGVMPLSFKEAGRGESELRSPYEGPEAAIALILYTSGTTGEAKGAAISHAALLLHTIGLVHERLRFDRETRALAVLPLTHSFGLRMSVLAPLYSGGLSVLLPRFDPDTVKIVCREEKVSWLPAVPTMLAALAASEDRAPMPSLEWALSAGAPLSEGLRQRASEALGCPIYQGYGLTEATFSALDAPPSAPVPMSVGRASYGTELAILRPDGTISREPNERGELLVRGQNLMSHYLNDPEKTRASFVEGFFRTGDIGRIDEHGRLFILDREKDLILRGGENIYPSEVEAALIRHPSLLEVAVVGIPHEYYGEEVIAVVRAKEAIALSELRAFAESALAPQKLPSGLAFIESFPIGASAKILKRELRRMLIEGSLPIARGSII